MPVAWSDLYTAITLVRMLDALLQSPWNDDAWAPYERLFPATDPEAAAYLAQLKLDRIGRAVPAEPALSEIADLLGPSGALDAPTNVKARAAWSFLAAKRAMTDKQYRAAFDQCQAALTTADRQLEVPVRKHLDDLSARSVAWADLPRWAQSRLANHLKNTLEQRYLLWLATTWLIKDQNLDRADLQYVKGQLEIARSSNLPTGVAFPAQMTAVAWDKSIDEAIKSLNAEMQRLAGS
jgi:hypothetical protein